VIETWNGSTGARPARIELLPKSRSAHFWPTPRLLDPRYYARQAASAGKGCGHGTAGTAALLWGLLSWKAWCGGRQGTEGLCGRLWSRHPGMMAHACRDLMHDLQVFATDVRGGPA
jgi:hypothetical protein